MVIALAQLRVVAKQRDVANKLKFDVAIVKIQKEDQMIIQLS